ncbi:MULTISPECIES: periplasmic heavy metal sensor [unclassified Roseitalea]|uniref:periplasmic heavy metal sensor n=1 Tax=unclassified Roseitalea TaxID=2639107 RepID=UPI00273EC48C|nr:MULTISPECIES: periplasmic heavy metal sensor [unclassified Roseitalea]
MTARRLNWVLAIALVVMTTIAAVSAGAAVFMLRNPGVIVAATQAFETYPRPLRVALRGQLRARARALAPEIAAYDRARTEMFEAMRARPFDRQRLDAAMADVRAAVTALQAGTHEILADAIEDADPELRRRIELPRRTAIGRYRDFIGR